MLLLSPLCMSHAASAVASRKGYITEQRPNDKVRPARMKGVRYCVWLLARMQRGSVLYCCFACTRVAACTRVCCVMCSVVPFEGVATRACACVCVCVCVCLCVLHAYASERACAKCG